MKKPAVFLDRDGTLIEEKGYLRHAAEVNLPAGAAGAVRMLRQAGFAVVLITNQSAVARGFITEAQLVQIHARLQQLLQQEGAMIDAIYYCPHHPDAGNAPYRQRCDCRKPGPGLFFRAAREHSLSLPDSFLVGDKLTDIAAGQRAGCRTVLVRTGYGEQEIARMRKLRIIPDFIAGGLDEAARRICSFKNYSGRSKI